MRRRPTLALLLAWLLAGCAVAPAAPTAPLAPSAERPTATGAIAPVPLEPIKVGIPTRGLSALPMYVLEGRGLAAEEGLSVEILQLRGATSLPALLTGELDYNGGWGANTDGIQGGAPIKLLAFAVDRPMHWVVAQPDVATLADLRGKRVAVSRVGGTDYQILSAALSSAGLQDGDVEQLFAGDDPLRLKLLLTGQVEATTLVPPGLVEARREGLRLLVAGASLVEIPTFALAATERKLAERPDQVVRLLRAFVRALRTIQVEGEALTPLVAETFGYDEPVAAESLRLVLDAYSRDGALPEASLARILAREGLDPSAVDGRFLTRAQQDVAGHQ